MGRRSHHSREELQQMVMEAVREIVAAEGVRGLSTRKIVAKIGYTVGTLYHFFENLDDIILQVNGQTLDKLQEFLAKRSQKAAKKTALRTLAQAYLEFSKKHFAEWQLLFEYPMPQDLEYPAWYAAKVEALFTLAGAALQSQIQLPEKTLARASRVVWSGIHGICALYHSNKLYKTKSENPEELVDDFIRHYVRGL